MDLNKNCNKCSVVMTTENAAKKNAASYRGICKPCRSATVTDSLAGNPKRQAYMRDYIRRVGIVKEYPCETCQKLCYKKYSRAFCSDECRLFAYVDKQESCWIWIGPKNRGGYGKISFRGKKTYTAHRASYELFNGVIEENMFVCHSCDVPSCVNPKHLWLGTNQDNMTDMTDKGRQYSKLEPTQVFEIRSLRKRGYPLAKLREMFNITSSALSNILARRVWKHV